MRPEVESIMPRFLDFLDDLGYRHGAYCDFAGIDPANRYFNEAGIVMPHSPNVSVTAFDDTSSATPAYPVVLHENTLTLEPSDEYRRYKVTLD